MNVARLRGYSIYIPQSASLAAPLMESSKAKYERAPGGGKCKVSKDRNFIERTETMRQSFAKINEALCEKCALYIPIDRVNMRFTLMPRTLA